MQNIYVHSTCKNMLFTFILKDLLNVCYFIMRVFSDHNNNNNNKSDSQFFDAIKLFQILKITVMCIVHRECYCDHNI